MDNFKFNFPSRGQLERLPVSLLKFLTVFKILGSFRLDYEYEIEYEYDFQISNQWRFQSPHSTCWF